MGYLGILITTVAGTVGGLVLWAILFHRDRVSSVPTRRLIIIVLAVGLLSRVAFLVLTPTFNAPDEHAHFNYIKYIAEKHSFPVQTSRTGDPADDYEYYQSPLYYLSLTPFYSLVRSLTLRQGVTVRLLRGFSIIFWGISVLFTLKFLRRLQINDGFSRLFVVSMVALLPTYAFLSSVINNDNLIMAIGGGILYLAADPKYSLKNSMLVGVLLGLGLLTKLSAVVYVPLIIAISIFRYSRRSIRLAILHAFGPVILAGLIFAPWAWRNLIVYGSVTAENVGGVPYEWNSLMPVLWATLADIQRSFWAVSGRYNGISSFYPTIGKVILYIALMGLLYGLVFQRDRLILLTRGNTGIIIASAFAILVNLMLVFRFGLLYGQGQGRYLFPLLPLISWLMAIGLRMFTVSDLEQTRIHVTGFFITYTMSFTCFSLATLKTYPL